ncbi:protein of unknown function [Methylocaldum szegediense]|uniref:Uncharacterized protein n=1 Tax=Methylocaldum szegediense TaxID=73780 RepID=A0ABN8XBH1_9GAMM|nr:protein of unknown function [Methylocaldum szegediense]
MLYQLSYSRVVLFRPEILGITDGFVNSSFSPLRAGSAALR